MRKRTQSKLVEGGLVLRNDGEREMDRGVALGLHRLQIMEPFHEAR